MFSPCECKHNTHSNARNARLIPSVVLAVAPAVTMNEATSRTKTNTSNDLRYWAECTRLCKNAPLPLVPT